MNWKGLISFIFLTSFSVHASRQMSWDNDSDPMIMSPHFTNKFQELPLEGLVASRKRYWSGDYWAFKKGSINYRWYAKNKIGFNLNSPNLEKAKKLSLPELAELSPAEKYDLFTGRYDYPLSNQVSKIASPGAEYWEGICHGWSPATMNHDEPTPKVMRNPDDIRIPFGSTDIKALLSFYYAHAHKAPDTHQMGKRCFKKTMLNFDKDCIQDMNAGAFHIVLGNRIGINGEGLIADLQRFEEVWNHPVRAYRSTVLKETAPDPTSAPGTVKILEIKTQIEVVDENGHDWHPVIGTKKQAYETVDYQYKLDLDQNGNIVGGDWVSFKRPDFLWIMQKPRRFEGILSQLGELLDE